MVCIVSQVPVKYEPKVPIDTPPIEIAPVQEPKADGLNQKMATIAIAPSDYVPIFNAKVGGGPPAPPSPELLKKAVNERLDNKQNQ